MLILYVIYVTSKCTLSVSVTFPGKALFRGVVYEWCVESALAGYICVSKGFKDAIHVINKEIFCIARHLHLMNWSIVV
jgi:hypothetical protein